MMRKLLLVLTLQICLLLTGCNSAGLPAEEPAGIPAETDSVSDEATAVTEPAKAYLVVRAAGTVYEPTPLYAAGHYTIRQGDSVNVIEVTKDSMKMAEATCANQDCVEQGVVSLENKDLRVLQNMIICLPNDVVLELYSYEELLSVMPDYMGGQVE